ncbi:MAG: sulfurtransferase [Gammaproteobacteria bacterium]|nr:sulfurtransferase [Gammaproteobacteria bacterium]
MQYKTLIDVQALASNLGHPDWVLFDCRFDLANPAAGREAYAEGHIPGAYYADLDGDLSGEKSPSTGRHPLPDPATFARTLGAWGVDRMVQVVVYDADNGAFASRLWWMLRWMGHDAVAVLDGGYRAWTEAAGAVTTALPTRAARTFEAELRPGLVVPLAALDNGDRGPLIDARTPERYRGESEPIDPVAGHIPGALNLPLQGNLDARGRFRAAAELRERYAAALGGASPEAAIHYCGSGVSACHNVLAMEHAGLHGSRLYVGSWSEWIRDGRRPVATGAER